MKTRTEQYEVVEYHELEAHIREVYNIDDPDGMFSVVAMEEWNNDTQHAFWNMTESPLNEWDQQWLDEWKADPLGHHPYRLHIILRDMVNNGHLKPGNYVVTVCW